MFSETDLLNDIQNTCREMGAAYYDFVQLIDRLVPEAKDGTGQLHDVRILMDEFSMLLLIMARRAPLTEEVLNARKDIVATILENQEVREKRLRTEVANLGDDEE